MAAPYISRRLKIDAGRVFACIPYEGVVASPIVNNVFFPWTFDRKDPDFGVPWHTKVRTFELDFSFSGTYDLLGVSTPFSYAVTGLALERDGIYGDRRDRQLPGAVGWFGAETTPPDTTNVGLNLFFKSSPIEAVAADPWVGYQADATDIAPAFFFVAQSSLSGIVSPAIQSYPDVPGAPVVGTGTIDGQLFDLYSSIVDGITILSLSASATITTLNEYTF